MQRQPCLDTAYHRVSFNTLPNLHYVSLDTDHDNLCNCEKSDITDTACLFFVGNHEFYKIMTANMIGTITGNFFLATIKNEMS